MEAKTTHGLTVISKIDSAETVQHSVVPTTGVQQSLFPLRSRRSAIFVSLPDVDHRDFVSLLQSAASAVVVELREIPRFDIGPLNRQSIFDLFRQQGDVYLDLGTEHFGELTQRDVLSRVQKALQQYIKQQRPILFLTSASQNPPSFSKSILEWLKESSEPWEVYEVPQHGAKWAAAFIA